MSELATYTEASHHNLAWVCLKLRAVALTTYPRAVALTTYPRAVALTTYPRAVTVGKIGCMHGLLTFFLLPHVNCTAYDSPAL